MRTRGSVPNHFARTTFCWFPPLSCETGSAVEAVTILKSRTACSTASCSLGPAGRARRKRRAVLAMEMFSSTLMSSTSPNCFRSAGTKPIFARIAWRGSARAHRGPVDLDPARGLRLEPEQGAEEIAPARADEPGDPDDLTRPDVEADALEPPRDAEVADAKDGVLHLVPAVVGLQLLQLTTDHEVHEPRLVEVADLALADDLPVAENSHPVDELEELLQPVGDEHRRHPAALQAADRGEERRDLVVGERARRLVEDQHAGVGRECPGDFDELLEVGPQPPHRLVEVDVAVQAIEDLTGPRPCLPPIDPAPRARLARAKEDVLGDGEIRDDGPLLADGRDPGGDCLRRVGEARLDAFEHDPSRVGVELARDHLQERGLAGPVLAAEAVHLARAQGEVRATKRVDAAEALADALRLEDRRRVLLVAAHGLPTLDQAHRPGTGWPDAVRCPSAAYRDSPYSSSSCWSHVRTESTFSAVTISGASALTVGGTSLPCSRL